MYPSGVPGVSVRLVTLPNGVLVRVVEAGPASGRAVLMVHGWGGCLYSFAEQIPVLAGAGYRVAAIDLPGHGLSEKPADESHYTMPAMAKVVLGVADALGIDGFTYMGHSMGTAIGLRMVIQGERRIERLITISAPNLGRTPIVGVLRALSPRLIDPVIPPLLTRATIRMVLRGAFGTPGRPTPDDVDQYWATTQFEGIVAACRLLLHRFDFARLPDEILRSLTLPVLAIIGGRDRMVFRGTEGAAMLPNARVVRIPEGGHLVMQECYARANEEILAFLARN